MCFAMSFISVCLVFCNGQKAISRLQLMQDTAAGLFPDTKRREYFTPILAFLHMFPLSFRAHLRSMPSKNKTQD